MIEWTGEEKSGNFLCGSSGFAFDCYYYRRENSERVCGYDRMYECEGVEVESLTFFCLWGLLPSHLDLDE